MAGRIRYEVSKAGSGRRAILEPHSSRRGKSGRSRSHFAPGDEEFRVPPSEARPKRVFVLCHYCGFSPPEGVPESGTCPKCGGSSWERYTLAEPLVPRHMK